MRGPDGVDYPMSGTFHEVVPPQKLVFAAVAEDGRGNALLEALITVTFAELDGKTQLTVQANAVGLVALGAEMMQGMEEGWSQSLDRLAREVGGTMPGKMTITPDLDAKLLFVERLFDAPRELVFKAWSEAERLSQWWGPRGWTVPYCKVDFRPGGVWHYCMEGPGGMQSWGKAVYNEIVVPERIVYTDTFSDEAGNQAPGMPVMVITVEFIDEGGKTRVVSRGEFASREDLESLIQMGLIQGLTETWDRLEEYLAQA